MLNYQKELFVPSRRLRGFERGKVGPKDGNDFIGGNYANSIKFKFIYIYQKFLKILKILIFYFFLDAANVWGVDYDSSLDDSSKIRSSIGIGIRLVYTQLVH